MTAPRRHPLATASVVLSASGLAPLPVLGGFVGSGLGAAAGILIRREPSRWTGAERADAAVVVGIVTGPLLLATFGVLVREGWGWALFGAAVAYAAIVAGAAAAGRSGGRGAVGAAALGVLAVVGLLGMTIGVVLLVDLMIRTAAEGIAEG